MKKTRYRVSEMGFIGTFKSYHVHERVVKKGEESFKFSGKLADCLAWITLNDKGCFI